MTEDIDIKEEPTACQPNNIKRVSKDTVNKLLSAQVCIFYFCLLLILP